VWKEEEKKGGRNSADKKQKENTNGWPRGADLTLIIVVSTRLQVSTSSSFSEAPPQPPTCAYTYNIMAVVDTCVVGVMAMCRIVGVGDFRVGKKHVGGGWVLLKGGSFGMRRQSCGHNRSYPSTRPPRMCLSRPSLDTSLNIKGGLGFAFVVFLACFIIKTRHHKATHCFSTPTNTTPHTTQPHAAQPRNVRGDGGVCALDLTKTQ